MYFHDFPFNQLIDFEIDNSSPKTVTSINCSCVFLWLRTADWMSGPQYDLKFFVIIKIIPTYITSVILHRGLKVVSMAN